MGLREERRALGSETEVSELLGFALVDAVPRQTYAATLEWNATPEHVQFSPSQAVTKLMWSFAMPERNSELWKIDEVDVQCGSGVSMGSRDCEDRLETVLILHLHSADGALSEALPVTFQAFSPKQAFWKNMALAANEFRGNFRISNGPEALNVRLAALGSVGEDGADGELVGNVLLQSERGEDYGTTSGMVFYVARWTGVPDAVP